MEYVEQAGNIFKKTANGQYEHVPEKVEQDGSIFQFNRKTKTYDYVSDVLSAQSKAPTSILETPIEAAKELGLRALQGVAYVGEKIDRYTGAPTRSAISAGLKGQSPISAFASQFGRESKYAPTGKDIAAKQLGISEEEKYGVPFTDFKFSPAGAVGLGVDILADPTNVIPAKASLALGVRGASKVAGETAGIARMAANAATKGKYGEIEKAVASSAQSVKEIFTKMFEKPVQATDWQELKSIAEKHGINPANLSADIEFGDKSNIARLERAVRESPAGAASRDQFRKGLEEINIAFENQINTISNNSTRSALSAGDVIREGYDEAVDNLFKNIDFTYNKIVQSAPDITVTRKESERLYKVAQNIIDDSQRKLSAYTTNAQSKQLQENIRAAQAIQNALYTTNEAGKLSFAPNSFKNLVQSLQNIGEASYKNKNIITEIPPDLQTMRKLYSEIKDTLVESTGARLGKDIKNSLITNNELLTQFYKTRESVFNKINNNKISGEQLFKQIVEHGNTDQLKDLVSLIPDKLPEIKGAYLESVIKRNADGDVLFASTIKNLNKKKDQLSILFTPNEVQNISELLKLGEKMGIEVLSTSGTGASIAYSKPLENIKKYFATKTALEYQKELARKGATNAPTTPPNTPSAPQSASGILKQSLFRPSKGDISGKVSQVTSVQQTNNQDNKKEQSEAMKRRLMNSR